jgi:hypothetical protein
MADFERRRFLHNSSPPNPHDQRAVELYLLNAQLLLGEQILLVTERSRWQTVYGTVEARILSLQLRVGPSMLPSTGG